MRKLIYVQEFTNNSSFYTTGAMHRFLNFFFIFHLLAIINFPNVNGKPLRKLKGGGAGIIGNWFVFCISRNNMYYF
jgi:hypothetical protein